MKQILLFIFLLSFFSCHLNPPGLDNSSLIINKKSSKPEKKPTTLKDIPAQTEKDHEIYGAFQISKKTIILLRCSNGIELSNDKGKTWKWLGKKIWGLNEFTVDNKGIWWGLERWKGIHEPSYCTIHKSTDLGKTWIGYTFNPGIFFPYHINSKPFEKLSITNYWDNKIYELEGNDPQHHWKYIKQLAKDDELSDLSVENYYISRANDNNKLYVKRGNGKTDTLLSLTKAYNIYYIQKYKNIIYVAGPKDGNDSYFAIIVNEHLIKEFTIPGGDLNMSVKAFNRIILTSTEGAFLLQDNKLTHIFK